MQSLPDAQNSGTLATIPAAPEAMYELESISRPRDSRTASRRLLDALYRYRLMTLAIIAVFVAGGLAATWLVRPYYEADGSIIIERPNDHLAQIKPIDVYQGYDEDREIQTELTELSSHAVAARVIAQLNLVQRDPEIAAAVARAERNTRRKGGISDDARMEIASGVFTSKLRLKPDKLSRTVHVTYGSHNAAVASEVVNATIRSFTEYATASRAEVGQRIARWLHEQLDGVRQRIVRDQAAVTDYQKQHNFVPLIVPGGTQAALLDSLSATNNQLSQLRAERIANEAYMKVYPTSPQALPAELRTPDVEQAIGDLSKARSDFDGLAAIYQPGFPRLEEARERVKLAEARLQALNADVKTHLEKRYQAAQAREQQLTEQLKQITADAASQSAVELRYRMLKAQSDAEQDVYQALNQKLDEAGLMTTMPNSNIRSLDAAGQPGSPVYPQLSINLAIATLLGLLVAVVAAVGRDRFNGAITVEQLGNGGWALAPLGVIPDRQAVLELRPSGRKLLPAVAGSSQLAESYTKLAANLAARTEAPPQAVLITSASPEEGKTMTACNLGLALARLGWRTLVVDADVRRPGCHEFFGIENRLGLLSLQRGANVEPAAVAPNLDVLPCEREKEGQLYPRRLAEMFQAFATRYDYVLVDSSPGNLTGEAVLLSQLVDAVVVVLRWNTTKGSDAQRLYEELARAHAPLVGTVLNRTDINAPQFRYYRRHNDYYAAAA